ncbi:MAG TPA: VWA domain-containing protein [Blastocatellia bacterium]|nr:VWA domain-containing protein [Blastocatellia bacterium]
MTRAMLCSLALFAFSSLTPVAAQTTTPKPAASGDDALVLLDVQLIRAGTGEPVTRLSPGDIRVFEDGAECPVREISHGRLPLAVVLVVDVGKSFHPTIGHLTPEIESALGRLGARDEVAVVAFNESAEVIQEFTRDRKLIAQKFAALSDPVWQKKLGGKQKLEAGLARAGALMEKGNPLSRRVIVLMTRETIYTWLPRSGDYKVAASREVLTSGSTICGALLTRGRSGFATFMSVVSVFPVVPPDQRNDPLVIRSWASRTGGEVFGGPKEALGTGLAALFARLHERVVISIVPRSLTRDGSYHTLRMAPSSDLERREGAVEIRAIEGYFARPRAGTGTPAGTEGQGTAKDPTTN